MPRKRSPIQTGELSARQRLILSLVVREYIATAQPVGSKRLVDKYGLDASPATVRNELAYLTRAGYLRQPHTSAGRVPTERGYRTFVTELMGHVDLPPEVKRTIAHQFYQARHDVEGWMRLAASVLARQSRMASLVTAPHPEEVRYQHLELVATRGRQVLMVLVLAGGEVRQQMLILSEVVSQPRLRAVADRLNGYCAGKTLDELRNLPVPDDALEADILLLVRREMEAAQQSWAEEVYRDGLVQVLDEPEFLDSEAARRALRVMEERALLDELFRQVVATTEVGGVQVLIGGEGAWEELRDCAMVMARYGVAGVATGMLGVLGPMRMAYSRTIPTVRYVARVLSDLVHEALAVEPADSEE